MLIMHRHRCEDNIEVYLTYSTCEDWKYDLSDSGQRRVQCSYEHGI